MKEIILRRMTMRNFRGANQETEFGQVTTIKGWNGSGKSRHFDAFCWCLFGKDRMDRKDYEVKTRENGETLKHNDVEVTLELLIDGTPLKLTRMLKEQWVKPRGQVEEVFTGNATICFIDDVPTKIGDYQRYVSGILPDSVFKMITNPVYFCTMKWQSQREMLFEIAGTITDADVTARNKDFAALIEKLNGKTLADYKKAIAVQKNRAKKELEGIEPAIEGIRSVTPPSKDWKMVEDQLSDLEKEIAGIDEKIKDATKGYNEIIDKRSIIRVDIANLEAKKDAVYREAKRKEYDKAYNANQEKRRLEEAVNLKERDRNNKEWALNSAIEDAAKAENELARLQEERKKLLALFDDIANRDFNNDTCPYCGQAWPEEKLARLHEEFEEETNKELDRIQDEGKAVSEQIKDMEAKVHILSEATEAAQRSLNDADEQLTAAREKARSAQNYEEITIIKEDLEEWKELDAEQKKLEKQLAQEPTKPDTTELEQMKKASQEDRDQYLAILADRETIKKNKKAIEDLEQRGTTLSAEIAGYENEEYLAQQFSREKIEMLERKVNSIFRSVKFQLFDYTIDGNETECCIPLVNGVHYGVANAAGKLFAGFEIIQVLSNYYGVRAPIFTDNAESLSELPDIHNQMIYLEVTREKGMKGRLEVL